METCDAARAGPRLLGAIHHVTSNIFITDDLMVVGDTAAEMMVVSSWSRTPVI